MARIIKFRAKRFDNKEWVYGMLAALEETTIIIEKPGVFNDGSASPFFTNWNFVDKETIGQFTGLYDKSGKEIYEGDIIKMGWANKSFIEVRFIRGVFAFLWNGNLDDECVTQAPTQEWATVIGNIYDNPELNLKTKL